jgi:hypothetical protein
MRPPEHFGRFMLTAVLVYAALMVPWPGLASGYRAIFRCGGNTLFARFWFWPQAGVRFLDLYHLKPGDLAPGAPSLPSTDAFDLAMELKTRGVPQVGYLRTSSRYVGYGTTALLVALIVATPIPWRRRGWALLWGLLLSHAFIALRLTLTLLAGGFAADKAYAIFHPGPFWRGALTRMDSVLADNPAVSFVVPTFIWFLVAFRSRSRHGATGPQARNDKLGR